MRSGTRDPLLDDPAHGRRAIAELGGDLKDAAARNDMRPQALERLLLHDRTAWVDEQARVFYVDEAPSAASVSGDATPPPAPYPSSQTLHLHSSPGSQRTIFLDFDGATVTGTGWNDATLGSSFTVAGLDEDGDPAFNGEEVALMQEVWRQTAEDYAPFNVDVTTEDPGPDALRRTSAADQVYGTTVVFTADPAVEASLCNSSCGGVGYLDVFDQISSTGYHQPAWAFTDQQMYRPDALSQTASHEAGHNFGLHHDGDADGEYTLGHDACSPIMGGSSWRVSQWSKGEYAGATNSEDDVRIIGKASGAPLRADDHGDTPQTATPLGRNPAGTTRGLISTRADVDYYSLSVDCTGSLRVRANGMGSAANLDIALRLLDADGEVVAASDPAPSADYWTGFAGLDGEVTVAAKPGTYYAEVEGTGYGNPMTTGYSDYGSLGQYTLDVRDCAPATTPGRARITGAWSGAPGGKVTAKVSWARAATGGLPVTSYRVVGRRLSSTSRVLGHTSVTRPGSATSATLTLPRKAKYRFTVQAVNRVGAGPVSDRSRLVLGR